RRHTRSKRDWSSDVCSSDLKTLHRDKGYIHAIVRLHKQESMVFQRKLTILIDANSLQVENYTDNKPMLEIFNQFQSTDEVSVTRSEERRVGKECGCRLWVVG